MTSGTNDAPQLVLSATEQNAAEQLPPLQSPSVAQAIELPYHAPRNADQSSQISQEQNPVSPTPDGQQPTPKGPTKQARWSLSPTLQIFICVGLISVPLIVLSGVLLGLVLRHRLHPPTSILAQVAEQHDSGVYFVNFNATRLLVLATLSSSVAPIVTTFFMNLLSYPLSSRFVKNSEALKYKSLPTSHQLGLLILTLNGGLGAFWEWSKYVLSGKKRNKTPNLVMGAFWGLTTISILTVLLIVADTWLHFLTTTVQFVQLQELEPTLAFGRGLSQVCLDIYVPGDTRRTGVDVVANNTPCSVYGSADVVETYATVNKVSLINQVLSVNSSNLTYVLLTDAQISNDLDFSASTIVSNTQCEPITLACNVPTRLDSSLWNTSTEFPRFHCSSGFSGPTAYYGMYSNLTLPSEFGYFQIQFFNDSDLTEPATLDTYPVNPTYFALAALIFLPGSPGAPGAPLYLAKNDTEIIDGGLDSGYGYILKCNNTVFDATYTWVNGSFQSFLSLSPTNATMAGNLNSLQQEPGYVIGRNAPSTLGTVNPEISASALLAGFSSDTAQILADKFALAYSQAAVAYASGLFTPRANELEEHRTVLLATRLPLAPFYTLVTVNLLYTLISIVTAAVALYVCSRSQGTAYVKERLNVLGLVAHGFKVLDYEYTPNRASLDPNVQPTPVEIPVVAVHKIDENEWGFRVVRRTW